MGKDADKNYLGNLKEFETKETPNAMPENTNDQIDDDDLLPF